MQIEEAMKEIEYAKSFGTSGVVPRWEAIETLINYVKMMHSELDRLEGIEDDTTMLKQELIEAKEHNRQLALELEKKDKVIDEMTEIISNVTVPQEKCKKCIKEYFYKKVRTNK